MSTKIVISNVPPYFLDLDAPTLPAYSIEIQGQKIWTVWCKHCQTWHNHGEGDGHRISHCRPGSPYEQSGYNLAYAGEWPADVGNEDEE